MAGNAESSPNAAGAGPVNPDVHARNARDPAETLSFVRRVMARTQQRVEDGGGVLIWWGGLTALAVAATWGIAFLGWPSAPSVWGVWIGHNLLGWAGTLWAVRRSGTLSPVGRQDLATFAVFTVAIWCFMVGAVGSGAVEGWAVFTMVQLLIGMVLAFSAILEHKAGLAVIGLVLIVTVPALLIAAPKWAWIGSSVLCTAAMLAGGAIAALTWRKRRAARGQ
jgi:hypothetical protein